MNKKTIEKKSLIATKWSVYLFLIRVPSKHWMVLTKDKAGWKAVEDASGGRSDRSRPEKNSSFNQSRIKDVGRRRCCNSDDKVIVQSAIVASLETALHLVSFLFVFRWRNLSYLVAVSGHRYCFSRYNPLNTIWLDYLEQDKGDLSWDLLVYSGWSDKQLIFVLQLLFKVHQHHKIASLAAGTNWRVCSCK